MILVGMVGLLAAFVGACISVISLACGHALRERPVAETLSWGGRIAALVAFAGLSVSCTVLVWCFLTDDVGIQYVLDNHVSGTGAWGVFYRVSGLWAGREGSLLFWAWLIGLFGALVTVRRVAKAEPLDNIAVLVIQLVLVAFVGIMLFSAENTPFTATDPIYFNADGTLTSAAQLLGMNSLLQHWAMAIHPPMLFLGYAGLTVPFAYAIAACVVGRGDSQWVLRSERFALAAWMFLTLGIGLGAVWAYVVLGWGGYWGWDPVENASLLSWLVCVALIHSFTAYKRHGLFKCWAVMSACLVFAFCIVGTFISRSGIVQSVHAFEGDAVSAALFGTLIVASILAGAVGCLARKASFAPEAGTPEAESVLSKQGAYFVNNVFMILMACALAYLTVAQALPSWLPLGGHSVPAGTYEAVARPVGVAYLLMMAVCPLLGWCKTDPKAFVRKARVPATCAAVLFAILAVYWGGVLLPAYDGIVSAADEHAELVMEQGSAWYYNGLALVAFLVASLLIFNSCYQLTRVVRASGRSAVSCLGSCISHLAVGIILIGLVGSAMYVTEANGYLPYDEQTNTSSERFAIDAYELELADAYAGMADNLKDVDYAIDLDVYRDGTRIEQVRPAITLVTATQQQKYTAGVVGLPLEDLFVVYRGVGMDNAGLHLDVRVNRLISFVWTGMVFLVAGMFLSILGPREASARRG